MRAAHLTGFSYLNTVLLNLLFILLIVPPCSVLAKGPEGLMGRALPESQSPSSLCPSLCNCSEQKSKPQEQDPGAGDAGPSIGANSKAKIKSEILKSGIRIQCQSPALSSVGQLNVPALLAENVIQFDLSGNSLATISIDDFGGDYSAVQKLILKNNRIEKLASMAFSSLKSLKYLDLSNNQLTNFSSSYIEGLDSIERVKLGGNPLNCDCHLGELLTYVASRNIKLQGVCWGPAKLKDRSLARLVIEELACPNEDPVVVEMRPSTNQIVFEGDPLRLGCRLKTGRPIALTWLHRSPNQTVATVSAGSSVDITSTNRDVDDGTLTESALYIRHILPHHGGTWTCTWGGRSASVEVTVLSLTTPTCPSQITTSNKGRYSWPRTMANLKMTLPCQANANAQAFRLCNGNGVWEEADVNSCYYVNEVTKVLEQFAKTNLTFSKTSAMESARRLKSYLTDVGNLTDPHDAAFVTQTLYNYLDASSKHPELLPAIMDVYSLLIKQDPAVLADSRHGVVGVLQQAPLKTSEFEYQSSAFVVEKCGLPVARSATPGATCTWRRVVEPAVSAKPNRKRFQASCSSLSPNASGSVEASVRVPLTADIGSPGGALEQQNVILSLVASSNPFVVSSKSQSLVTSVLGVTSGHVTNLINRTAPFVITLRLNRSLRFAERLVGARWNQYTDQWSSEQCRVLQEDLESNAVTFQCCCGFGFFAVYASPLDDEAVTMRSNATNGPFQPSLLLNLLPPPVYVGSVIGVLTHLTACLVYLIHRRRLTMTQSTQHSLVNGWLSVAFLMAAFTVGIRPVAGKLPCQVAGLLLHYLTLSSLLWMVVNASSLYKHLTKSAHSDAAALADSSSLMEEAMNVGHDSPQKPALRFYLIGWGIPLIVVGIAGAIHLEQYYSPSVCFLARTPSLGAVGLPSAILILLILTSLLLSWCFLRHTSRVAAIQKQLAAKTVSAEASADPSSGKELAIVAARAPSAEKIGQKCGYLPLTGDGDGTSCPSNVGATQVTETSDLASVSSDQERIGLLVVVQRGEAEGALSANEGGSVLHSGRSESERPLLITSSASSDDRLEDGAKTDAEDQGHNNPLMASFTDDGGSRKLAPSSLGAPSVLNATQDPVIAPPPPIAMTTPSFVDDSDEKSTLSQLRGQLVYLILFCLAWLSGLCVVTRPFRAVLPHDELISSMSYALFSTAVGLHAVVFHLLTRRDVCRSCFDPRPNPQKERSEANPPAVPPPQQPSQPLPTAKPLVQSVATPQRLQPPAPQAVDQGGYHQPHQQRILEPVPESMNVSIMDAGMLVNSFYDARQSKTARRFFQKQRLLHQMQNNVAHHHHHRHHSRHSRHSSNHSINNAPSFRSESHSPIAEEALLNASSSSKAKVNNVNICPVEMGAHGWHELQSRMSDHSWTTKNGNKQLPARIDNRTDSHASRTSSRSEVAVRVAAPSERSNMDKEEDEDAVMAAAVQSARSSLKSEKRKRHRTSKKSRCDDRAAAVVESNRYFGDREEQPACSFANDDYREGTLSEVDANSDALKSMMSVKIKVLENSMDEDDAYLKRETSV